MLEDKIKIKSSISTVSPVSSSVPKAICEEVAVIFSIKILLTLGSLTVLFVSSSYTSSNSSLRIVLMTLRIFAILRTITSSSSTITPKSSTSISSLKSSSITSLKSSSVSSLTSYSTIIFIIIIVVSSLISSSYLIILLALRAITILRIVKMVIIVNLWFGIRNRR